MSKSKLQTLGRYIIDDSIPDINSFVNPEGKLFSTEISMTAPDNKYIFSKQFRKYPRGRNITSGRLYKSVNIDPDRFNLLNTVKKIRKSIYESSSDIFNQKIAYDEKTFDYVYKPRLQIMEYNERKANRLTNKDGSLRDFLRESKQTGINNYMIKNLQEESQKLNNLGLELDRTIENKEINYCNNNNIFDNCIHEQNEASKTIVDYLINLEDLNRQLANEKEKEKKIKKTIEDEMEGILQDLESLRESCKFVTKVIEIDKNKFNEKIIGKSYKNSLDPNDKPDFGDLTAKTIENYKFCLERNENEEEELNEQLNDPNIMTLKFTEIEDRIIRLINEIHIMQIEERIKKSEIKTTIHDMNERLVFHEKELEDLKKLCKFEENEINNIERSNIHIKSCEEDLIKELYLHVLLIQGLPLKINPNMKIVDLTKDCIQKIRSKEIKLTNLMFDLEKIESEEPKLFNKILNERKAVNKENKYLEQKNLLEQEREEKKKESNERIQKVVIKSRKTEAPFRTFKKIEPKDIIKEDEFEEYDIMFY